MKVAFVVNSAAVDAGGLSPVINSLSIALRQIGVDVHTISTSELRWNPSNLGGKRSITNASPANFVNSVLHLWKSLNVINPCLVHSHGLWQMHSVVVPLWCRRNNVPWVVSPHGMLNTRALGISRLKKLLALGVYERFHLEGASCLHALTDAEAYHFKGLGLKAQVAVIPNGIDDRLLDLKYRPQSINLCERKTLLFLGRLHPIKGIENLIDDWAKHKRLTNHDCPWVLAIAGWGDATYVDRLKEKTISLGVAASVLFLGPKWGGEKYKLFQNAHAFILPSTSEGLPIAVLEAWAFGLPCLVTSECNLSDGINSGGGLLIDPSMGGISGALAKLRLMSSQDLTRMGLAGRDFVGTNHRWSLVAQKMIKTYQLTLS